MDFHLTTPQKMLFALLSASLGYRQEAFTDFTGNLSAQEWSECYRLAARQGVMALAWGGVEKLPPSMHPPRPLKLQWGLAVEEYTHKYHRYCQTISNLSEFYKAHGIATVQLKGVGFSTYYPVPHYREGGDIDIFTFSADEQVMSHEQANRLADELMQQQGIDVDTAHSYKHSNFYYKGIPIENHKHFLNVKHYRQAKNIQQLLVTAFAPQEATLCDGQYRILVPSPTFNTLFISFHALQHYGCGITLHHLCDWACLLGKQGLHLPPEVTDGRYLRALAALCYLSNQLLGTDVDIPPHASGTDYQAIARHFLHEMLYGSSQQLPAMNKVQLLLYKTKRMWHRLGLVNEVFGEPRIKGVFQSLIEHLRRPETIFIT